MHTRHSIRLFFRTMMRRKLFSSINLIGLAFGIGFVTLIGQYLYFEFSYNRSLQNVDRIYRLVDVKENSYAIDYRVGEAIVENLPAVKNACLWNRRSTQVNRGDQVLQFENLAVVDSSFFKMLRFPFLRAPAEGALHTIDDVILTESAARRIFGDDEAVGQEIVLDHEHRLTVTGIVRDLPKNTSFLADLFISAENTKRKRMSLRMDCTGVRHDGTDDSQCKFPFSVFVELQEQADDASVAGQIPKLFKLEDPRFPDDVRLTPLKTNYFNTDFGDYNLQHSNLTLVKLLIWTGLIILTLAIINYVNLTTAGYKYRLTEIGIKKCVGVNRGALRKQLLTESLLFCLSGALLGLVVAEILLPYFNQFVDKPLHLQIFSEWRFSAMFLGFVLFLSLAAGWLPAVILSRISPLQLFQSGAFFKSSGGGLRNALTMLQFGVAIALIICLVVISRQIGYVKHKDLGFDTEKLLHLSVGDLSESELATLMKKFGQYHGVKALSATSGIPGANGLNNWNGYNIIHVDTSAAKTFGFKIVQGRGLLPGDSNKACLINVAALSKLDGGTFQGRKACDLEIVGVVADFHYSSLYQKVGPVALLYSDYWKQRLTARISGPVGEAVAFFRKAWMETCPDKLFDLQFYDQAFAAMYRKEENLATLAGIFTVLAVVISALGIFGLAVFHSQQRIKEIGIRKVLGATAVEITAMLTKNFIKWAIAANVLAWPVAYYLADKWLENFAYRIEIQWWMFALSGSIALVIALLTVSTQAIKAALANPVEALRYE